MNIKYRYIVTAFIFLVAAVMRNPTPVMRPELWAEDGVWYFAAPIYSGVLSIFQPIYGSFFLLQRIIAYIASFFPILYIPAIYSYLSILITALTFVYFLRDQFSWVLSDWRLRSLAILLLAQGPGSAEVFYNLSNLYLVFLILLFFLVWEQKLPLTKVKKIVFLLLGLSTPGVFVIFLYSLFLYIKNKTPLAKQICLIMFSVSIVQIVSTLIAPVVITSGAIPKVPIHTELVNINNWQFGLTVWTQRLSAHTWLAPLFGASITSTLLKEFSISMHILAVACLLACTLFVTKAKLKLELHILIIALVCASFLYFMQTLGRSYNLDLLNAKNGQHLWNHRYSFVPGAIALLLYIKIAVELLLTSKKIYFKFLGATILVFATLNTLIWFEPQHRKDINWPTQARRIQAALDSSEYTVDDIEVNPIYFPRFQIRIKDSK